MIRLLENSIECVPDNFGTQILRKTIDATRDEENFLSDGGRNYDLLVSLI